jgi:hypothetical protein
MAGERQHYLPQFLQRGFISKRVGDTSFTWVYRKYKTPFESNIRNVGLERKFYNQGNNSTVDIAITEAEAHEFSAAINVARSAPPGWIPSDSFPRLFAHLEVRSRQLREVFGNAGAMLTKKTIDAAMKSLPALLEKRWQHAPKEIREFLQTGLASIQPELAVAIEQAKMQLPAKNAESIKTAHVQALQKTVSPDARVSQYTDLSFSVVEVATQDLILGDGAVLFHTEGEKQFKSISEKSDVILAALLPLTPSRMLVGSPGEYRVDSSVVRRAIARCSHEFFISNKYSDANERLAAEIESDSAIISEADLDQIVRDAIAESI